MYHYQYQRKYQSGLSEDPCFTLFAGPDNLPALRAAAEIPAPLPSVTKDEAKTGKGPAGGDLADLRLSMTDSELYMDFGQDGWMTTLDEMQL